MLQSRIWIRLNSISNDITFDKYGDMFLGTKDENPTRTSHLKTTIKSAKSNYRAKEQQKCKV